jgi:hypothetical protein
MLPSMPWSSDPLDGDRDAPLREDVAALDAPVLGVVVRADFDAPVVADLAADLAGAFDGVAAFDEPAERAFDGGVIVLVAVRALPVAFGCARLEAAAGAFEPAPFFAAAFSGALRPFVVSLLVPVAMRGYPSSFAAAAPRGCGRRFAPRHNNAPGPILLS